MSLAWVNNPRGVCEDAPCCGCCGPMGDGRISDDPPEPDDFEPDDELCPHGRLYEFCGNCHEEDEDDDDDGPEWIPGESPDPYWMND